MVHASIDIDKGLLAQLQAFFKTTSVEETINAAIAHAGAEAQKAAELRGSFIERAKSGYFAELLDPEVERKMWS